MLKKGTVYFIITFLCYNHMQLQKKNKIVKKGKKGKIVTGQKRTCCI